MRELKTTKIEGRIYLFPLPVVKDRKYLILCSNEDEAAKISELVKENKLQHPDLISEDFLFLTYHSDKQTKVYVMKPVSD